MIVEVLKSRWRTYHEKNGKNPKEIEVTEDEFYAYKDYLFPYWRKDPKAYETIKELYFYEKKLIIK